MGAGFVRAVGGLVGGLVPATTAVVAWWLGFEHITGLAIIGIAPGAIAGCALAPTMIASRAALWPALAASALGVVLGIVVVLLSAAAGGTDPTIFLLLPVVVAYAIVLGFPVAIPTAYVATLLVRITARRRRWVVATLTTLVTATSLLAIPALAYGDQIAARRQLPSLRSAPPVNALLPVRLDWEIANCSAWTYTLRVTETHLDGTRSTHDLAAPPTSAVRGALALEPGWDSTIEADAAAPIPQAWREAHPAIRDAVGSDLAARIEIAPNGERSSSIRLPSGQELSSVPLCALGAPPPR